MTTFVVQMSGALRPSSGDISAEALVELVALVRSIGNGSPVDAVPHEAYTATTPVSGNVVWVNGLWFTSLILSLGTALLAVLAKQWLTGQYMLTISGSPRARAILQQFRFDGLKAWHLVQMIGFLPVLLHFSLFLFFAGLVIYLWPLHFVIAAIMIALIGALASIYLSTNILAVVDVPSIFALALASQLCGAVNFDSTSSPRPAVDDRENTLAHASDILRPSLDNVELIQLFELALRAKRDSTYASESTTLQNRIVQVILQNLDDESLRLVLAVSDQYKHDLRQAVSDSQSSTALANLIFYVYHYTLSLLSGKMLAQMTLFWGAVLNAAYNDRLESSKSIVCHIVLDFAKFVITSKDELAHPAFASCYPKMISVYLSTIKNTSESPHPYVLSIAKMLGAHPAGGLYQVVDDLVNLGVGQDIDEAYAMYIDANSTWHVNWKK